MQTLTFNPNVIKIDPYDFELYYFEVDAFFETMYTLLHITSTSHENVAFTSL